MAGRRTHGSKRVLVVGEGEETEYNYFMGIKRYHHISTLEVEPPNGTSPLQVVRHAEKLFKGGKGGRRGFREREFDMVFAVFDRDSHPRESYNQALDRVESLDKSPEMKNDQKIPARFVAIPSNPCFELWFFLHFAYEPTHVPSDDMEEKLKRHYPGYQKNAKDMFENTLDKLDTAIGNAQRLAAIHSRRNDDELYTAVDELVVELTKLGKLDS